MRQLLYVKFISNNHASFHLRCKENLVKHQEAWKYYENDCSLIFFLLLFSPFWLVGLVSRWEQKAFDANTVDISYFVQKQLKFSNIRHITWYNNANISTTTYIETIIFFVFSCTYLACFFLIATSFMSLWFLRFAMVFLKIHVAHELKKCLSPAHFLLLFLAWYLAWYKDLSNVIVPI